MFFLGHFLLIFFSGFTQYLLSVDKGNNLGIFLMLCLPITGVYFLGWWALLSCFAGFMIGAKVYVAALRSKLSK